jgi:hypothetical protein
MEDHNKSSNFTLKNLKSSHRYYPTRLQDMFNDLMYECDEIMMATPNMTSGKFWNHAVIVV